MMKLLSRLSRLFFSLPGCVRLGMLLFMLVSTWVPAANLPRPGRVLVLANSGSAISLELATAYRRSHDLPLLNLVFVSPSNPVSIQPAEFAAKILAPVRQRLSLLGNDNVDYIVICRDVPYRVGTASTTSALMFDGVEEINACQGYYRAEFPFDATLPLHFQRLRPATVIAGENAEEALGLIERAQVKYPNVREAGRFYFCAGAGPRGIRNPTIPGAVALMAQAGARVERSEEPSLIRRNDVLAQFTGDVWIQAEGNRYLPGSILDNLTSYGGYLLDNRGQSGLLSFVRHGVCGAYGTVTEPTNNPTRWADYMLPLRYIAGYNLMDAYLASIQDWQFGTVVGDPLMAPFAPQPTVKLTPPATEIKAGEPVKIPFSATAANAKQSLTWLELWLNDQDRVVAFTDPLLPAGTQATLAFIQDGTPVAEFAAAAVSERLPVTALLQKMAGKKDLPAGQFELLPVGRFKTRLLCRWRPAEKALAEKAMQVKMRLVAPGTPPQTIEFGGGIRPTRIGLPLIQLDLGAAPSLPGDRLVMSMERFTCSFTHEEGDTMEMLHGKLEAALRMLPAFAPNGPCQLEWRNALTEQGPRPLLALYPTEVTLGKLPPLALRVERVPGSQFGKNLPASLDWSPGPAWVIGETVLTVFWPLPKLETTFTVPAALCSPGWNVARCVVGSSSGTVTEAEVAFMVTKPGAEAKLELGATVMDFRETLPLRFASGPELAKAFVELLVDDRVVATFPPGSTSGNLRLILPYVCPGEHQVRAQWVTESNRSPAAHYMPLVRTAPLPFRVRHPLGEKVTLTPDRIPAGVPTTLTFTGPYLRNGLSLRIGDAEYPFERDSRNGLLWRIKLPAMPEGGYKPEIIDFDPATESGGPIPLLLFVKPSEKPL